MSEWKKTYLRDLIVIKNGKDHKKLKNGQYPVYGSGGIMRYADSYLYDQESVLLPRKGTLNNIQFVTDPFWTVDTCYYTVVNRDKVLPYFLYCCLCKMDIQSLNTGSAVPSMTFEKYYSIEVPLPPLSTQHRIASILSRYDSLIENYQKQIKLLEEAARRLYKEWFIDLRFPGHENTKIVDGVPEGWEVKSIIDVYNFKYGKILPTKDFVKDGAIPVYGASKQIGRYSKANCFEPKVLIGSRGNAGFVHRTIEDETYVTNNSFIVEPKKEFKYLRLPYIYESLKVMDFVAICTGAAQPQLTLNSIASLKYIIPSDRIITDYCDVSVLFFKKIAMSYKQLRLLAEARDRLLPRLMSGEITV